MESDEVDKAAFFECVKQRDQYKFELTTLQKELDQLKLELSELQKVNVELKQVQVQSKVTYEDLRKQQSESDQQQRALKLTIEELTSQKASDLQKENEDLKKELKDIVNASDILHREDVQKLRSEIEERRQLKTHYEEVSFQKLAFEARLSSLSTDYQKCRDRNFDMLNQLNTLRRSLLTIFSKEYVKVYKQKKNVSILLLKLHRYFEMIDTDDNIVSYRHLRETWWPHSGCVYFLCWCLFSQVVTRTPAARVRRMVGPAIRPRGGD